MPIDAANLPPVLPLRVTMRAAEAQLVPAFRGLGPPWRARTRVVEDGVRLSAAA